MQGCYSVLGLVGRKQVPVDKLNIISDAAFRVICWTEFEICGNHFALGLYILSDNP
jgi:hypothetical protein